MAKKIWLEQYPTRNGIAVPACELEIPESEIDMALIPETSNHHDYWSAKKFGRQILYSTLRDLEICQSVLPNYTHDYVHSTYEPPELPRPYSAYQFVLEAFEYGVKLRTGSANKPEFKPITLDLFERVHENYKKLKTR